MEEYSPRFFAGKWPQLSGTTAPFIREQLKEFFEPKGMWGVVEDKTVGVINTNYDFSHLKWDDKDRFKSEIKYSYLKPILNNKDSKRSLLNYLDSNLLTFAIIVNWMNAQIKNGYIENEEEIDFTKPTWKTEEVDKFKRIFKENRQTILEPGYVIFDEIIKKILYTTYVGYTAEIETIKRIQKNKGITNIIQSKNGESDDFNKGIDIKFTFKGKDYTIQCKTFTEIKHKGNTYIIKTMNPKHYSDKVVNYYSFYSKNFEPDFYIFANETKNINIFKDYYIIPDRLLSSKI